MNITIVRERLIETLQKASYFTSAKLTDLKIFKAVLLEAKQNTIIINTTNVNDYFSGEIGGKVLKTGKVLIDLKTLIESVKNLNDTKITLEKKNNQLIISGSTGQIKLMCLDEDNFPSFKEPEKTIEIKKDLFKNEIVQAVLSSCATDEARPILTGVCFDFKDDHVLVIGTDGFRLSLQKKTNKNSELRGKKIVISSRSLVSVLKVFKNQPFVVFLANGLEQIIFGSGEIKVSSKTIEGEYPPYEKVIPQGLETNIILKTKDLLEIVKASSLLAKEGSGMINLTLNNKELIVNSAGAGVGEAQFKIPVVNFSGKDNKIVFNYRYLLEFLSNFSEEEVVFEMSTAFAPGVFRGQKNTDFIHIIMPIRSQE